MVYMVTVWQASPRTHQHKLLEIVTTSGKNFLGDYLELKNHMDHGTDFKPVNISIRNSRYLTRALLGLWIFHDLLGGGVWTPPRLSRLLRIVEQNGKRRSKAREKSFRNHFGHFLAQVKIEVTRGQNSKIFQNDFWTIKSLILKVEQRFWYHRVCLVKARRTMYNLTLKGQGQNLTSGQVRARSLGDPSRWNYTSFDAPCGDKRNDSNSTSLSYLVLKLLAKKCWWPWVTSMTFRRVIDEKFHLEYQ